MTPRETFIAALELQTAQGGIPRFELEFVLAMEAFGRIYPSQRRYQQWDQMSEQQPILHRMDVADLQICVARQYEHAEMLFRSPPGWREEDTRLSIEHVREQSGQDYLITLHDDTTYSIPKGDNRVEFSVKLAEQPQMMKDEAQQRVDKALARGAKLKKWDTIDGFCFGSDYCFNDNPFLPPAAFDEFVTLYLRQLIKGYREMGFYTIKHTDGNIMPILNSLVSANPHALHSLDQQGEVIWVK